MGFKRTEYKSEEEKREQRAKERIRDFVKHKVKQKNDPKMEDEDYWKKEFMKSETPEINDESGTEYWGNLLSIYRSDKRKRAKEKVKEENSKAMRGEAFATETPTETPAVDYLSIKKKV